MKNLFTILAGAAVLAFSLNASALYIPIVIDDVTAGTLSGTAVGSVDTWIASHTKPQGQDDYSGSPEAEAFWVNSVLTNATVTYTVKTDPVTYYSTDVTNVFAFNLVGADTDYFLIKNSTSQALYQNLADVDWGVFNVSQLGAGFNLNDLTISHVTEFDSIGEVPIPAAIWLFGTGLIGLVAVGRRKQV